MKDLIFAFSILFLIVSSGWSEDRVQNHFNITAYGAVGDSLTNNTTAIQSAIDDCQKQGGGVVLVPSGVFMTGTIFLRDRVCLDLSPGSELRAIPDISVFPDTEPEIPGNGNIFFRHALIYAENANDIGIRGQGTINGQGHAEAFKQKTRNAPQKFQHRPGVIRFVNCKGIRMENVRLMDSGFWTVHLMASRDIVIHGISLYSRTANYNNDGIDVDGCEDVRISDCYINSLDDAISIKATGFFPVARITITNCILSSHCSAVRIGAENFAGFEDVHFSNIHIYDSRYGITFQNLDGFPMKRMSFRGISMNKVANPIHVVTGRKSYPLGVPEEEYPCQPRSTPASIEDLVFDHITGSNIGYYKGAKIGNDTTEMIRQNAIILSGHPDAFLKRCIMSNIYFRFIGGGKSEDNEKQLPDVNALSNPYAILSTPVFGIIARNTENLRLVNVDLTCDKKDERPAIAIENSINPILRNINTESYSTLPVIQYFDSSPPCVISSVSVTDQGETKEISVETKTLTKRTTSFFE